MRRFLVASLATLGAILTQADRASAQYVYGYRTYVPGYGVVLGNRGYVTPYSYGYRSGYYSPFTGAGGRQYYYGDYFGNQAAGAYSYNPWTGLGAATTYYGSPGTFIGPYYTGPYYRQYTRYFRR